MLREAARWMKRFRESRRGEDGFTLIELLIVITLPFHKQPGLPHSLPS